MEEIIQKQEELIALQNKISESDRVIISNMEAIIEKQGKLIEILQKLPEYQEFNIYRQ